MSDYKKYLKGDYQGTKFEKTAQKRLTFAPICSIF